MADVKYKDKPLSPREVKKAARVTFQFPVHPNPPKMPSIKPPKSTIAVGSVRTMRRGLSAQKYISGAAYGKLTKKKNG